MLYRVEPHTTPTGVDYGRAPAARPGSGTDGVHLPGGIRATGHGDTPIAPPPDGTLAPRGATRHDLPPLVAGRQTPTSLRGTRVNLQHGPGGTHAGRDGHLSPDFVSTVPAAMPWTDDLPTIGGI